MYVCVYIPIKRASKRSIRKTKMYVVKRIIRNLRNQPIGGLCEQQSITFKLRYVVCMVQQCLSKRQLSGFKTICDVNRK